MTTELVLLIGLFAFLVGGVFFGDKGPIQVFGTSGPRLGARIERNITIGRNFKERGAYVRWVHPDVAAPDGHL